MSWKFFPEKGLYPMKIVYRMTPAEKTSTYGLNFAVSLEEELMISGATYPGVPHLLKRYEGTSHLEANPKSTILTWLLSISASFLSIKFSSLRSLCMIPLEARWLSPDNISNIIFCIYHMLRCFIMVTWL